MMSGPKYPNAVVRVDLAGPDSNSFVIIGKATAALRAAGVPQPELDAYSKEASSGDFANLLKVTNDWCDFMTEARS